MHKKSFLGAFIGVFDDSASSSGPYKLDSIKLQFRHPYPSFSIRTTALLPTLASS